MLVAQGAPVRIQCSVSCAGDQRPRLLGHDATAGLAVGMRLWERAGVRAMSRPRLIGNGLCVRIVERGTLFEAVHFFRRQFAAN